MIACAVFRHVAALFPSRTHYFSFRRRHLLPNTESTKTRCTNTARSHTPPMVINFHWLSLTFTDFYSFSLIFIHFPSFTIDFHVQFTIFRTLSAFKSWNTHKTFSNLCHNSFQPSTFAHFSTFPNFSDHNAYYQNEAIPISTCCDDATSHYVHTATSLCHFLHTARRGFSHLPPSTALLLTHLPDRPFSDFGQRCVESCWTTTRQHHSEIGLRIAFMSPIFSNFCLISFDFYHFASVSSYNLRFSLIFNDFFELKTQLFLQNSTSSDQFWSLLAPRLKTLKFWKFW